MTDPAAPAGPKCERCNTRDRDCRGGDPATKKSCRACLFDQTAAPGRGPCSFTRDLAAPDARKRKFMEVEDDDEDDDEDNDGAGKRVRPDYAGRPAGLGAPVAPGVGGVLVGAGYGAGAGASVASAAAAPALAAKLILKAKSRRRRGSRFTPRKRVKKVQEERFEEWAAEKILESDTEDGVRRFLIKWANFSDESNSWVWYYDVGTPLIDAWEAEKLQNNADDDAAALIAAPATAIAPAAPAAAAPVAAPIAPAAADPAPPAAAIPLVAPAAAPAGAGARPAAAPATRLAATTGAAPGAGRRTAKSPCRLCSLNNFEDCDKSALIGCKRCEQWGLQCVSVDGLTRYITRPEYAGVGNLFDFRVRKCVECVQHNRPCDRAQTCISCTQNNEPQCTRTPLSLTYVPGSATGDNLPLYFQALGWDGQLGVPKNPPLPQVPGPPYPLELRAPDWPLSYSCRLLRAQSNVYRFRENTPAPPGYLQHDPAIPAYGPGVDAAIAAALLAGPAPAAFRPAPVAFPMAPPPVPPYLPHPAALPPPPAPPANLPPRAWVEPEGPSKPWTWDDDYLPGLDAGGRIDPLDQVLAPNPQNVPSIYQTPGPYGGGNTYIANGPWLGRLKYNQDNFYSRNMLYRVQELERMRHNPQPHFDQGNYDAAVSPSRLLLTRAQTLPRVANDPAALQRAAAELVDPTLILVSLLDLQPLASVKVEDPIGEPNDGGFVPFGKMYTFCKEPIVSTLCSRDASMWCDDLRHPKMPPAGDAQDNYWVCRQCDHDSKVMILDEASHGLNDLATALNLRMYFCSHCTPGLVNRSAWQFSGFRVWFRGVEDDPSTLPVDGTGFGAFMPDCGLGHPLDPTERPLPAITGCSCSAKLLYRRLCRHHRLSMMDGVVRAAGMQREFLLRVYGTANVCPRCLKPGGGAVSVVPALVEQHADPPAPTVMAWMTNSRLLDMEGPYAAHTHLAYMCLACQDRVVGPKDVVKRNIKWPRDDMDPLQNPDVLMIDDQFPAGAGAGVVAPAVAGFGG